MKTSEAPRWFVSLLPSLLSCSQASPSLPSPQPTEPAAIMQATPLPVNARQPDRASADATAPLPPALRLATIEARQAEATAAHRVRTTPAGLRADVTERQVSGTFDAHGATLRGLSGEPVQGHLRLASVGRANGKRQPVADAAPVASEHAVRWEHPVGGGSLQETWQAGPLGLEHRVLVRQKPAGSGAVELQITVEGLTPQADGEGVKLVSSTTSETLAMGDYFVRDAQGTLLAGAMSVREGRVVYRYEDEGAVYPVEVDPLVWGQQAKLFASDKGNQDYFGQAVALSTDGTTALVGAWGEGAAYVFVRSGMGWIQQQKLTPNDGADNGQFGYSLAMSSDGKSAFVGAPYSDDFSRHDNGAIYFFVSSGGLWNQQQKLLANDLYDDEHFGTSISMSIDGQSAIVGAPHAHNGEIYSRGSAYVFKKNIDGWSQQAKIIASDIDDSDEFGAAVSLSTDGKIALVGSPYNDEINLHNMGAAYLFENVNNAWFERQKILPSDKGINHFFGVSASLSGDGATALIGASDESDGVNYNHGAVYVFSRSDSEWVQQQKILASDKRSGARFGRSISLSSDGQSTIINAMHAYNQEDSSIGAVYLFKRSGDTWVQQQKVASGSKTSVRFAWSVAMSPNGAVALASDDMEDSCGAVYVLILANTNGDACSISNDCASGFCADGVCCDTACDGGPCDACAIALGADTDGTCRIFTGPACDDNNACTQTDTCQAGFCTGSNPVLCTPQDPCHDTGSCDPTTGACSSPPKPDSTPCSDGSVCSQADTCQGGLCTAGESISCDDGDACTTDSCDAAQGCTHFPAGDGSLCSDDNACTSGDSCQAGVCQPGTAVTCTPGECQQGGSCEPTSGACVFSFQPDGTPCTTGLCQHGSCQGASGGSGAGGQAGTAGGAGTSNGGTGNEAGASGEAGAGASGESGTSGQGGATAGSAGGAGQAGSSGASGTPGQGGVAGQAGVGAAAGAGQGGAAGEGKGGTLSAGQAGGGQGGQVGGAPSGGQAGQGGKAGGTGQVSGASGVTGGPQLSAQDTEGGCGCRTTGRREEHGAWALALLALGLGARRRRVRLPSSR